MCSAPAGVAGLRPSPSLRRATGCERAELAVVSGRGATILAGGAAVEISVRGVRMPVGSRRLAAAIVSTARAGGTSPFESTGNPSRMLLARKEIASRPGSAKPHPGHV
jgi:hypothetical protein